MRENFSNRIAYVDGTLATSGDGFTAKNAVKTLSEAATLLHKGGIIVVCGNVDIRKAEIVSSGGELVVTSVYNEENYTDVASIKVASDILLYSPTTFRDIVLDKVSYNNDYICANCNKLVIDNGVYCRNILASSYISICGGAKSDDIAGNTDITIKSGYFRSVIGGNIDGDFKGSTNVNFIGGYVDNMIVGGNLKGNFEGNAAVNICGDAVVVETQDGLGVVGASCGLETEECTFKGDIHINLSDSARVNQNLWGGAYHQNVTTVGNVYITVKDDAYVHGSIYAGGYSGMLYGNTSVIVDSGWVGANLSGGCHSGTVTGDTHIEINGGQINYYFTNWHSSYSKPAGTYNIGGGGFSGFVCGNTKIAINGGDIYGNVYGGSIDTGFVSGNSTVTLTGGSIMCGVYADGKTKDSVSGSKMLDIDLSNGNLLSLGLSATVNTLIGGGKLTLFPEATITADTFSGSIALDINGVPQARDYITATAVDNATVSYTAQDGEEFIFHGGKFSISSEGYFEKTKVIFKHVKGVEIHPRAGLVREGNVIPADEKYDESTVFYLAPGMYNYLVYHSQEDYKRKYIYITGKESELTFDFTNYTPMKCDGFESPRFYENFEVLYEKYFNTKDLVGFKTPDTPYFANNRYGKRYFTSNDEVYAYTKSKVASCDYAYMFDAFTSPGGVTVPMVVYTKDRIPKNATVEDVAKIVNSTRGRDIIMITAIVHGEESSAGEGALAMIGEMCGEYGNGLLTGNIGAVIVIPRLNPDGCAAFSRSSPYAPGTANRDYMALSTVETAATVRIFNLFAPTVLMDLHEAPHNPVCGSSNVLTDIYDIGFVTTASLNTGFVNAEAAIHGDYKKRGMRTVDFITDAMKGVEEKGFRAYYFYSTGASPTVFQGYACQSGAIGMTIEIAGLHAGDSMYARRVFAQITAMKAVCKVVKDPGDVWAKEILAARERVALSSQKYNANTPIVLKTAFSSHDVSTPTWNNPLVAADSTIVKPFNITKYQYRDIAVKYRSRPTAYVVRADAVGIDSVLSLLDKHTIDYYLLDSGTTLKLKQYGGDSVTATLSETKNVSFDQGAYIIPVDGYRAYITSILFEPEYPDSDIRITFVELGYLAANDIYRSEESFIAAKLGLAGTYKEVAIPEGKTVASAIVNGTVCNVVDTEENNAYIVASESGNYAVTLNFTDETSETVHFSIF